MTPWIPEPYAAAERLEARLGDPADSREAISFARALELDERDEYPEEACRALDAAGVSRAYVPTADGGDLRSIPELAAVFRVVARRDLTLAIAHHKTFFAAVHLWTAGNPEQRARVAEYVRGGGRMALAYHERDHGSDLMATETSAAAVPGGFRLTGVKWLVNNATRGDLHCVFARTREGGGVRGFSLFLVDRRALPAGAVESLPGLKSVGARGADFSGARYVDAPLPAGALIGRVGEGLELTLRSFQITRTLVPAVVLGAADTALRTVLSFALERRLYGKTVFDLPRPRSIVVDAFADLLACECVVASTARALHVVPDEMRLWSAVAKAFVPAVTGRAVRALGEVLGARSYLRDGHRFAVFQKIARDHDVIPIFHAGGFLLMQTVGLGLPHVVAFARRAAEAEVAPFRAALEDVFSLAVPLPPLDAARLRPYPRVRGLSVAMDAARTTLRREDALADVDADVRGALIALADALRDVFRALEAAFEPSQANVDPDSCEFFALAERYCAIHAGTVCLGVWLANRGRMDPHLAGGHWLVLALSRIAASLGVALPAPPSVRERVADHLLHLFREHRAFSIVPWALPGASA